MSFWHRLRDLVGLSTADFVVEDDRLVFRNLSRAREIPVEPKEMGPAEERTACDRCGAKVRRVVFTTAGKAAGQRELWRAHPLAVDGWACPGCGSSIVPRRLTPEEVIEFGGHAAVQARQSAWDDAEWWLRRVLSSWPGYPPALADLAQVELGRAAEAKGLDERQQHRECARGLLERAVDSDVKLPLHGPKVLLARVEATCGREAEALTRLDDLAADEEAPAALREDAKALATAIRGGELLFDRASELAFELLMISGAPRRPLDERANARLRDAKGLLAESIARGGSFRKHWLLGKVEQRLGNAEAACAAFAEARRHDPDQPDGCRELIHALLELGRATDAVPVARHSVAIAPKDAGLRSNLALVLLLAGDIDASRAEIAGAQRMDPGDPITRALAQRIREVASGQRRMPRTLAELERG